MSDFLDIVPVRNILAEAGIESKHSNFEVFYSDLAKDPSNGDLLVRLEEAVYDYFDALEIVDTPTVYDYLLLSLRRKDVLATFNWDPLLLQAARRNPILKGRLPTINYLHGNVSFAYCYKDRIRGTKGIRCSQCGSPFEPSKLLYPVLEKDYTHPVIADAWDSLRAALKSACMVTIFGYSAPAADQQAKQLLLEAWGGWQQRNLEQFEIIDIAEEKSLRDGWDAFIHTHHYEIHRDYFESWLARHPRRTGEAWRGQYMEVEFLTDEPLPRGVRHQRIWQHVSQLIKAEEHAALLMGENGLRLL